MEKLLVTLTGETRWFGLALVIGLLSFLLYGYVRWKHSLWLRLGVPGPPSAFICEPVATKDWPTLEREWMLRYGTFYGRYLLLRPILVVTDVQLVKQIMVKDFDCFINRFTYHSYNRFFNSGLFFNNDPVQWRKIRPLNSRSFTSAKLRNMAPLVNGCVERLIRHLDQRIIQSDGVFQPKPIFNNLVLDIVTVTGYSSVSSADYDRIEQNPLVNQALNLSKIDLLRWVVALMFPRALSRLLNVNQPALDGPFRFYATVVQRIIEHRRLSPEYRRDDVLQGLLNATAVGSLPAQKGTARKLSEQIIATFFYVAEDSKLMNDNQLVGNFFFFMIAGYETTASILSHMLFELAWQPAIQERLWNELHATLNNLEPDSERYYEIITAPGKLNYMEAIIDETFRKYPPITNATRQVMVDGYRLRDKPLPKGLNVWIPIHAIHYNPEYWPDPDRFDPERFMPENRHRLTPYAYLPFGLGPRICIAQRYSMMHIKFALVRLVMRYRFEPVERTPQRLQYMPRRFTLTVTSTFPLRLVKR